MHVVWNRHNSLKREALRGHWQHPHQSTHHSDDKHMHGSAVAKDYGVTTIQILRSVPVIPET